MQMTAIDPLETLSDAAAALSSAGPTFATRHDAQNIDLMGLAGFCRNCLADWIVEAAPRWTRPPRAR
jgi:hypothetical protein